MHILRLDTRYFEKIAAGEKTVELRLFDEKRQRIAVGDEILFADRADPARTLRTRVVALHRFADFAALFRALPHAALGYAPTEQASPADMECFYTREEIARYGVVGIEIRLV